MFSWSSFYYKFRDSKLKINEDQNGNTMRCKIKHYYEYLVKQKDDSPLVLNEDGIEGRRSGRMLTEAYHVPKYFREDLFSIMGESNRPLYKNFNITPERSGLKITRDEFMRSTWDTCINGKKLWIIFPDEVPKFVAEGTMHFKRHNEMTKDPAQKIDPEIPIDYFYRILPQIIANEGVSNLNHLCFVQKAGETVYIPSGCWYAYVSIEDSMSVMEKYAPKIHFDNTWKSFRCLRKKLSQFFIDIVAKKDQNLYQRLLDLNERDGYQMPKTIREEKKNGNLKVFRDDISTTTYLDTISQRSNEFSPDYYLSRSSKNSVDSQTGKR